MTQFLEEIEKEKNTHERIQELFTEKIGRIAPASDLFAGASLARAPLDEAPQK